MMTQRESPDANHQILGLALVWTQDGCLAVARDGSVSGTGVWVWAEGRVTCCGRGTASHTKSKSSKMAAPVNQEQLC